MGNRILERRHQVDLAGKQGQKGRKPRSVPDRYSVGWLDGIDRRYRPAIKAHAQLTELHDALGGRDQLSPQQRMLTERATWLHLRLQQLEQEWLAGQGMDSREYAMLTGSLVSVLARLGLRRQARDVSLSDILKEADESS